jgi:DNA-binding MarR family transcriptional regulator
VKKRGAAVDPRDAVAANPRGTASAPGTYPRTGIATWLRIVRFVNSENGRLAERLRAHGVSLAQFDVIAQIGSTEGLTQKDLAGRLLVTEGNVTQLLQKMEKKGLVTRRPDGQCNRLRLSAAGRRLYARTVPAQNQEIARLFAVLTRSDREMLSRLMRKVSRSAAR